MSATQKIWLSVSFSVACSTLSLFFVAHLSGDSIPFIYWAFATFCPLIVSYVVSRKLVLQGEQVRQLHLDLQKAHALLQETAESDPLTHLLNRGGFLRRLEERESHSSAWLLLADVDHFKSINDHHGHDMGDRALEIIANALQQSVRAGDFVGRLGGEEFAIYLPETTEELAAKIAERVRIQVESTPITDSSGARIFTTISIGMTPIDPAGEIRHWFQRADIAMYRAKHNGRNQVMLAA